MRHANWKVIAGFLVLLLVTLQYRLWFQSGGIRDMFKLKGDLVEQIAYNNKLKKINEQLLKQIKQAHNNQEIAEFRARQELGMVKKGEQFYQIVRKKDSK